MHIDISGKQKATLGLYFHVPFCPHLCPYCDFVKTDQFSKAEVDYFFESLLKLSKTRIKSAYPNGLEKRTVTVYFGGGTPGLFWGSKYLPLLDYLRENFSIEECTIETNPAFVSEKKIKSWFEVGFDRVTLGVQSTNEKVLQFLGRRHTAKQVLQALDWCTKAGFANIQADMIYGLPHRFADRRISEEVHHLVTHGATGISSYALTVEQNTLFSKMQIQPCDELACEEYEIIQDYCEVAGLTQREISNFSMFECKHNNIYWFGYPYEGFGPGAHGLLASSEAYPYGRRYSVGRCAAGEKRPQEFPGRDRFRFSSGHFDDFELKFEPVRSRSEYLTEMLFTLLRTPEGVPLEWLKGNFSDEILQRIEQSVFLRDASKDGKLVVNMSLIAENCLRPGLSLSKGQYLLGDWWHQKLARELGLL